MINSANAILCGGFFVIVIVVDTILGSGVMKSLKTAVTRVFVPVTKSTDEVDSEDELMLNKIAFGVGLELVVLSLSMLALHNFKRFRGNDRFDELLNESKTALREANKVLDKWQNRSILHPSQEIWTPWECKRTSSTQNKVPSVYSYLNNEKIEESPVKVEMPILHMAIVDTVTRNRDQQERGDAADTISIVDSTLLSLTSLFDDDEINERTEEVRDGDDPNFHVNGQGVKSGVSDTTHVYNNRYLWNVEEEDSDSLMM